jgi:Na+(H+)/acetate symporter ActP
MQAIGLQFVDWVIILFYFAFIIGMGFYLKRYTKNEEDFFLAGRRNSAWVAGLARTVFSNRSTVLPSRVVIVTLRVTSL